MINRANAYIEANRGSVNGRFKGIYHLSPEIGWMNDPNGFVYYKGQYHIFWQYNPYSTVCVNMHWGHAVSDDLIAWTQLPVALAPDRDCDADGCWSGSAIVVGERLYLLYTGHYDRGGVRKEVQCLAWSDDGICFEKYESNPVIGEAELPEGTNIADFRDPFVWKHDDKYYLLVGTMEAGAAKVLTYRSDDLIHWQFLNNLDRRTNAGYCWECPTVADVSGTDLFVCSPVDYPHGKYAFHNYNSTVYATGAIDYGKGTMSCSVFREVDHGLDFYAAQIISGRGGVKIMTAWMNMWARTYIPAALGDGWTGSLVLPRELSIKNGALLQKPAAAIENYFSDHIELCTKLNGKASFEEIKGTTLRLRVAADMSGSMRFAVSVFANEGCHTDIYYDKLTEELTIDRTCSQYAISADPRDISNGKRRTAHYALPVDNKLRLDIYLDVSSIELFAGEGELVMSSLSFNDADADKIIFYSDKEAELAIEKDDISIKR